MRIQGVIFDLGHTLMGLDGTWAEVFERGAADLAAFLDGQALTGTVQTVGAGLRPAPTEEPVA